MRKSRKPKDIRREDCVTDAQKLAYSKQQYYLYKSLAGGLPSEIMDLDRFPMETEPWHSPEYWIAVAKAAREKQRLLRGK